MTTTSDSAAIMRVPIPRLYLGTMSFGWSQTSSYVDEAIAKQMLEKFVQVDQDLFDNDVDDDNNNPPHRVDTARIYAGGKTETIVGSVLSGADKNNNAPSLVVALGSKAHPSQPHGLSRQGIQAQLEASKVACRVESFAEYYLHQPDTASDLLESLKYLHELVQAGTIRRIGMSNYHYTEMKRAFDLCRTHQLTPPSVYQGLYNPLNRMVEQDLIPLLHANNCSFVAYNPLAAGLLTGKHSSDTKKVPKGRFKDNPNYLPRFYTPANFDAVTIIQEQCIKDEISMVDATYLWLLRHSSLKPTDGVLLGASSLAQLDENLQACLKAAASEATLSNDLLEAFEKAHALTKDGCFPYWRSYSADMPHRETLDQGAAYEATKK